MGYGLLGEYVRYQQRAVVEGALKPSQFKEIQKIFEHLDAHGYSESADRIVEVRFSMAGQMIDVFWLESEPNEMEASLINEIWEMMGHCWDSVQHSVVNLPPK